VDRLLLRKSNGLLKTNLKTIWIDGFAGGAYLSAVSFSGFIVTPFTIQTVLWLYRPLGFLSEKGGREEERSFHKKTKNKHFFWIFFENML
jgi:hypothetical protein